MTRLVIASGNVGKLREYGDLLAGTGLELVPYDTHVEETGTTYLENARLKAEEATAATGLWAIGDDSGLEVDALGGFPGVYSARLAPTQEERTAELLRRLDGAPPPWLARFVSVVALARPHAPTTFHRGQVEGEVIPEWRGSAGFGYDPIFLLPEAGQTFGEMTPAEKHHWSHRAAAVRALLQSGELARRD